MYTEWKCNIWGLKKLAPRKAKRYRQKKKAQEKTSLSSQRIKKTATWKIETFFSQHHEEKHAVTTSPSPPLPSLRAPPLPLGCHQGPIGEPGLTILAQPQQVALHYPNHACISGGQREDLYHHPALAGETPSHPNQSVERGSS